jgi:hypothetical protein
MRHIVSIFPQQDVDMAYKDGVAAGVFIKDMSGKPCIGQVGDIMLRHSAPGCKHCAQLDVSAAYQEGIGVRIDDMSGKPYIGQVGGRIWLMIVYAQCVLEC